MVERSVLTHSHWGAFHADVVDGRVVGVRPFEGDPNPSPMIETWPSMLEAPTRIRTPMVREGYLRDGENSNRVGRGAEPFVSVSWDTALDLVAGALASTKATHGNASIFGGSYGWASAGRLHHAQTLVHRFLFAFGGCVDQVTNYSWGAAQIILPHVIGSYESVKGRNTSWRSVCQHGKQLVAFGGLNLKNAQVTAGGPGEHVTTKWLHAAVQAGVRFVVISPFRDDAPSFLNARWVAIRPGTDTALMLGLCHTLLVEQLHDEAFLDRYCVGFDKFCGYLTGETDGIAKTAKWAQEITGIDAVEIRDLAQQMAKQRTLLTSTWSLQRGDHGEQPYWTLVALASMLGQIGLPGGGFGFGHGSINGVGQPRPDVSAPTMPTGENPVGLAIPVSRIADMLLSPGSTIDFNGTSVKYPDIKVIYWAGGNPFHHHQDINRLLQAWRRPATIIVHESWWTATARHADIVLPATTTLERNDIGSSSRDRFVIAMKQVIAPVADARNDFAIFEALAQRLGMGHAFSEGLDEFAWLRRIYEGFRNVAARQNVLVPDFDTFWDAGYLELPEPEEDFVMLEDFRRNPDLHRLNTPSGRIELFSRTIADFRYEDCPGHPSWIPPTEWLGAPQAKRFPLHLLTSQPTSRLHSQMDPGIVSRQSKVAGREPLTLHSSDAAARGIEAGNVVRVFNDRGSCLAGAKINDNIMPGVVLLPTGAWYDPIRPGEEGCLEVHGNPNVLTLDKGTSKLAQAPSAMSALVEVERFDGVPPPVLVFDPPVTLGN